jgi:hypothetical protein
MHRNNVKCYGLDHLLKKRLENYIVQNWRAHDQYMISRDY